MPSVEGHVTNAEIEDSAVFALERGWIAVALDRWAGISHVQEVLANHPEKPGLNAELLEARLLYLALKERSGKFFEMAQAVRRWIDDEAADGQYLYLLDQLPLHLPDTLLIGCEEIDEDHRNLVGHINRIGESLSIDRGAASTAGLVASYIDAARAHFAREEDVMAKVNHPNLKEHITYHGLLALRADELVALVAEMTSGSISRQALFQALSNYLFNDPIVADIELRPYFQESG